MKHLHKILFVSLLLTFVLTGCKKQPAGLACPFTNMTWKSSVDDVIASEGKDYTTKDSMYKGKTYSFHKKYLDLNGTVMYMFDDNNKLMNVTWVYAPDKKDNLKNTYDKIHKELKSAHGKSGYNVTNGTTLGDVWYLDEGDIILSAVTTDSVKLLQYSYLNPKVSNKEP